MLTTSAAGNQARAAEPQGNGNMSKIRLPHASHPSQPFQSTCRTQAPRQSRRVCPGARRVCTSGTSPWRETVSQWVNESIFKQIQRMRQPFSPRPPHQHGPYARHPSSPRHPSHLPYHVEVPDSGTNLFVTSRRTFAKELNCGGRNVIAPTGVVSACYQKRISNRQRV
nr:uncharacterized protein LOC129381887 isoform X1 [Dermacentor andersoni]